MMASKLNGECVIGYPARGHTRSPIDRSSGLSISAMRTLVIVMALGLLLIGCGEEKQAAAPPADIAAGKVIGETRCANCHDLEGRGLAPGLPNLAAQTEPYLLASLLAYRQGTRTHAALQDLTSELTDADLRNVAGFYASLPPLKDDTAADNQVVPSAYEQGKEASRACARCHGEAGNGTTAGIPNLAGQQPRFFISAVRAYLEGRRSIEGKEMLRELDHVDLESLALYYATQTPARREAPAFGDPVAGEPLSGRCGGCHGARGVSHITTTPSLAGQDAQYLVRAIKAYRDQTRQHSVMLDDNTDEEIENLAAFYAIQESEPAERGPITAEQLAERCDRCHGADVEQPSLTVPKIAGQDRAYLVNALIAYRDGKRESSMMHSMSLPYSEALVDSVAALYASQPAR